MKVVNYTEYEISIYRNDQESALTEMLKERGLLNIRPITDKEGVTITFCFNERKELISSREKSDIFYFAETRRSKRESLILFEKMIVQYKNRWMLRGYNFNEYIEANNNLIK